MSSLRIVSLVILSAICQLAHAQTNVTIYEFYNSNLKQYFRTASAVEAGSIDAGGAGPGWSRTGDNFSAWTAGQSGNNLVDVCRFYGSQSPGPNSHFFTASKAECDQLKALQASTPATKPRWNYEGLAFMAKLPENSGNCAAGSVPIYRNYNQGAAKGIDSNHRFTTQKAEYDRLAAAGWAGEGVVMCACDPAVNSACVAPSPPPSVANTSAKRLMSQVITQQCASCHTASSPFGAQSGLLLDGPNALAAMVNAKPKNAEAATHGFKLITPGNAETSFLYTKLVQWDPSSTHKMGAPMPLGGTSLSVGQLDFIKRWINEGASETADTIPPALLADQTAPSYLPFSAPAPPTAGLQLTTDPFVVIPNFERELFIYRPLGNPAPVYINRIDTKMRANSHHFVLYAIDPATPTQSRPVPNVVRDLRDTNGVLNFATAITIAYHIYVGGSMAPDSTYTFPPGIALELPANTGLDLNSHYVNKTSNSLTGEAFANLYTVDKSAVSKIARTLNLNNTNIQLPANKTTTLSRTFTFTETRNIIMLTSHMHKLGEKFVIKIAGGPRNGEVIYETTDWSHPFAKSFDTPLVLQDGQGLTSEITWNNTTSKPVNFGLTSEDEMGIIFGYYY
jgi:Repeat of unknown function (DUF5648)